MAYDFTDPREKILAEARRYREEAMERLVAVEAGTAPVIEGATREGTLRILIESIAIYEETMRRFGWRGVA